jgi:NADH-ubiquinone oxidoreductase chain 5
MLGVFSSMLLYSIFESRLISLTVYKNFYYFYSFLIKKWYFDVIYNHYIVHNVLYFGYNISFKLIDRGLIELIGPLGITRLITIVSKKVSEIQTGLIYHYAFAIILGVIFFILLYILPVFMKIGLLVTYLYTYIYLNLNKNLNNVKKD